MGKKFPEASEFTSYSQEAADGQPQLLMSQLMANCNFRYSFWALLLFWEASQQIPQYINLVENFSTTRVKIVVFQTNIEEQRLFLSMALSLSAPLLGLLMDSSPATRMPSWQLLVQPPFWSYTPHCCRWAPHRLRTPQDYKSSRLCPSHGGNSTPPRLLPTSHIVASPAPGVHSWDRLTSWRAPTAYP